MNIPKLTIKGLQEAQDANLRVLAALKPRGALGRAVQWGTSEAHRSAAVITHVDTGALRASHRTKIERSGLEGRVSIDPNARNPRGEAPAEYGVEEHDRGGEHAFYKRVEVEQGSRILRGALDIVMEDIE